MTTGSSSNGPWQVSDPAHPFFPQFACPIVMCLQHRQGTARAQTAAGEPADGSPLAPGAPRSPGRAGCARYAPGYDINEHVWAGQSDTGKRPPEPRAQVRILPGALNRAWSGTDADTALLTDLHLYNEAVGIMPPHAQDCLCLGVNESWHPRFRGPFDKPGQFRIATSSCAAVRDRLPAHLA
jgi:hypothetical protein